MPAQDRRRAPADASRALAPRLVDALPRALERDCHVVDRDDRPRAQGCAVSAFLPAAWLGVARAMAWSIRAAAIAAAVGAASLPSVRVRAAEPS